MKHGASFKRGKIGRKTSTKTGKYEIKNSRMFEAKRENKHSRKPTSPKEFDENSSID